MPPPPRRTVTLEAKVLSARGLVSSKGEETPVSSASITLLGFDLVESELVSEASEPRFELSTSTSFHADDASCFKLLTTPTIVRVFEGALPAVCFFRVGRPRGPMSSGVLFFFR